MIFSDLEQIIKTSIIQASELKLEPKISLPPDSKFGDFSVALFELSPENLQRLLQSLAASQSLRQIFEKIEISGSYLNFFLNFQKISKNILEVWLQKKQVFGATKPKKILLEYSQPNTHKPFHVGHLRNACLGSSLSRILKYRGNHVTCVNYFGDIGTHVARCLWYFQNFTDRKLPDARQVDFLGSCYSSAVKLLELDSLTRFPYEHCSIGKIIKLFEDHCQINTGKDLLEAGFDEEPGLHDIVIVVSKKSNLFKQLPQKAFKFDFFILPKKHLSQLNVQTLTEEAVGQDPMEFFKIIPQPVKETFETRNKQVSEILNALEKKEPFWTSLWIKTRNLCIEDFKKIYDILGCHFDYDFSESEVTELGHQIVEDALSQGVLTIKDGAVGLDLGALGFLVLKKSDGSILYSTRDLALAKLKEEKFVFDKSIYVVDASQAFHFKQVFKAVEIMKLADSEKLQHLPYALVTTSEGKISSRAKNYYTFWQLLDSSSSKIKEMFLAQRNFSAEEKDNLALKIAVGAIVYGMVKVDNNTPVVFDLDAWLDLNGNSGPYLLYSLARLKSILREIDCANLRERLNSSNLVFQEAIEFDLLRHILLFETALSKAEQKLSPAPLADYVYKLAQLSNKFYASCPVLKVDKPLKISRVALVMAIHNLMEVCLSLLGIQTVDKM